MVVIPRLPTKEVIRGFKGLLDFYVHNGQAVVRRWPKYDKRPPTRRMSCNQRRFALFMKGLKYGWGSQGSLENGALLCSGWRNADYAYRRYMGRTPFSSWPYGAPFKDVKPPCPDVEHLLINHGHVYWQYEVLDGGYHFLDLVAWVDRPYQKMDLLVFPFRPPMRAVTRMERGVLKQCALEPLPIPFRWTLPMDDSYYGEWPPVTHNMPYGAFPPWPPWLPVWATIKRHIGDWAGRETGKTFSTGPLFRIVPPPIEGLPDRKMLFYPVAPIWRETPKPDWPWGPPYRKQVIWRPPWYPRFDWPPNPDMICYQQEMMHSDDKWLNNPDY